MHVQMADEAYHIGGATSGESYLRGDRILDVCKKTGAQGKIYKSSKFTLSD